MLRQALERACDRGSNVAVACALSFLVGIFFVFVWAPHPWGYEGLDEYRDLALALASNGSYPTLDRPWGYACFLAAFYRVFGDHPSIPLVAQVTANACLPLLTFAAAAKWVNQRTAVMAALMTGVFSFNTVYASTQSSDALCTVIFLSAVVAFVVAAERSAWPWFALAGVLAALSSQFRPNLVLIPLLLAVYAVFVRRTRQRLAHAIVLLVCSTLTLTPWIVRNYRLTGLILPTSVRGGVQLWYGTLQVGPYLNSRAYNPRAVFETPVFDYTSLDWLPLIVSAHTKTCAPGHPIGASLVYWTDHDGSRRDVAGVFDGSEVTFEVPLRAGPSTVYYYLTTTWSNGAAARVQTTPAHGAEFPLVYFVSRNHLGDLDIHGDVLDSFDLIRMMRHLAWNEALTFVDGPASAGLRDHDLAAFVDKLRRRLDKSSTRSLVKAFAADHRIARLTLTDSSTIVVPRNWSGRISDVEFTGPLAVALMTSTLRLAELRNPDAGPDPCSQLEAVAVNQVFYLRELHSMRRYLALSMDNIERDPWGFALASAYRALRLFVIRGTDDPHTAQQFAASRPVYALGTAATTICFVAFVWGAIIALRRGDRVGLPLLLIAYVPATIAPMLTNMRYLVTVQPLMFVVVALAVTSWLDRSAAGKAGTRTPS